MAEAGWLDGTVENALKNVGEKVINENANSANHGGKKTLKDSIQGKDG